MERIYSKKSRKSKIVSLRRLDQQTHNTHIFFQKKIAKTLAQFKNIH